MDLARYTRHFIVLISAFIVSLLVAAAGVLAQQWVTSEVDRQINFRLAQVEQEIGDLRVEIRCQAVGSRIDNLRDRLEESAIALLQAEQENNEELASRIRRQIDRMNVDLQEERERYAALRCAVI